MEAVIAFPTETSDLFAVATPGIVMNVRVSDGGPQPVASADINAFGEAMLIGDGFISGPGFIYEYEVVDGLRPYGGTEGPSGAQAPKSPKVLVPHSSTAEFRPVLGPG